jgi:hypothetical protein
LQSKKRKLPAIRNLKAINSIEGKISTRIFIETKFTAKIDVPKNANILPFN